MSQWRGSSLPTWSILRRHARTQHHRVYKPSSPSIRFRSDDAVTVRISNGAWNGALDSQIASPRGEKRTSLTAPRWPGSLCNSLPVLVSQTTAVRSPLPAAILCPVVSQLALNMFFSMPDGAPSYVIMWRFVGANGRMSHVLTVESCELDSKVCASGDTCREVIVSVCPLIVYATAFLRMSQTLISLSMPPEYSSLPASENATAVTGNSVSMKSTAFLARGSHSCQGLACQPLMMRPRDSYSDVAIIACAHEDLFASPADIHTVDDFFMANMPPYALSRFRIPACKHCICGRREQNSGVSRPM